MIRDGKGGQGKGGKGKVSEEDRKGGMKEKEGKGREREGIRGRKRSEVETDRKGAHPVEKGERGGKQTGGKYPKGAQKRNLFQFSAWSVKNVVILGANPPSAAVVTKICRAGVSVCVRNSTRRPEAPSYVGRRCWLVCPGLYRRIRSMPDEIR